MGSERRCAKVPGISAAAARSDVSPGHPNCATGEIFRNRVQVLFTGGISLPSAVLPATHLYYTQMIVAYPDLARSH